MADRGVQSGAVVSDQYRMHRLRPGDEWVLGTLARGNARFGDGSADEWQPPLGTDEAVRFCADPGTIFVVAIELATNHIAGFVYGGVLLRRHTKLHHLCLYEIGVDVDHRKRGVGSLLMQAFATEARQMGIDRGFVITNEANRDAITLYREFGATRGGSGEVLFGLQF